METINRTCKTCNKPFSISPEEQQWLAERKLENFSHCKECRIKRREARAAAVIEKERVGVSE